MADSRKDQFILNAVLDVQGNLFTSPDEKKLARRLRVKPSVVRFHISYLVLWEMLEKKPCSEDIFALLDALGIGQGQEKGRRLD